MTVTERATLVQLFESIGELRSDIMHRFDAHDERLRSVETKLSATNAVEQERVRVAVKTGITKRWAVGLVATAIGIVATIASIVTTIVLRFV